MSIHISDEVVISLPFDAGVTANNPRIGWHNLVNQDNVFAVQEAAGFPASNLGLPATFLYWKGTSAVAQAIGVTLEFAQPCNYIAIARHNLGSIGAMLEVQSSADGTTWQPLSGQKVPANDRSIIWEFPDTVARYFRLLIGAGSGVPEVAVLYVGRILRLQRRIYVGHTPLPFGRQSDVSTNFSEDGQFLGRVVHRRMFRSQISQENVTPSFYRANIEPFFEAAIEWPFFVAWRPGTYPNEVGYVWLVGDPTMQNQRPNGMVSFEFAYQGIR